MSRNIFETLNFSAKKDSSNVIDLTDDADDSDDNECTYPDTFSSDVCQLLNDKSISAVLSNVEIFYKSQLEFLLNNRYDEHDLTDFIEMEEAAHEDILLIDEPKSSNGECSVAPSNLKSSDKQMFSPYYFLKQTFNCPMALIDNLIDSWISFNINEQDTVSVECPQQIEIETGLEAHKSDIVTKKDLRMVTCYDPPKIKKPKCSKRRLKRCKKDLMGTVVTNGLGPEIEVVDLVDSDEEMMEVHLTDGSDVIES